MTPPECDEMDYISFLVAVRQAFSGVQVSRTHRTEEQMAAHNAARNC